MELHHGTYRIRRYGQKPIPLSRDLGEALTKYAAIISASWSGRTLGDVIDRYRLEILPLKKSARTRKNEGLHLDNLRKTFADMLPDSVTAQHCYRYMDMRRDRDGNPAPSAARHEIALLGHVFAKAIRWGVCVNNPVRTVEKSIERKPKRYVNDEEYRHVWNCSTERMRVAMDLALLTGLRRGDLIGLRKSDLTDEGIIVRPSKTADTTAVALLIERTPELDAVLERAKRIKPHIGPGNFLLRTREGNGYTADGFSANFRRAVDKAIKKHSIARFAFHDIRRKSASDSASIQEAQERLGHSSEAVTRRFYIARPVRVRPLR